MGDKLGLGVTGDIWIGGWRVDMDDVAGYGCMAIA